MAAERGVTLPLTRKDKFDNLIIIKPYILKSNTAFIIKSRLPLEVLYIIFDLLLAKPTTIHIALSTIFYPESQSPLMPLSQTCKVFREIIYEYGESTSGLCTTTAFGVVNLANTSFNFKMTDWCRKYYIPVYHPPHMPVTIERFALWKKVMLALETDDKETVRQSIINELNDGDRILVDLLIRSYKLGGIPNITEENLI